QKRFDNCDVSVGACQGQRHHSIPIQRSNIRTRMDQQLNSLIVVPVHCPMERCAPVRINGVDVGMLLNQCSDGTVILCLDGVDQRRMAVSCSSHTHCRKHQQQGSGRHLSNAH